MRAVDGGVGGRDDGRQIRSITRGLVGVPKQERSKDEGQHSQDRGKDGINLWLEKIRVSAKLKSAYQASWGIM
jgi:hypothetical protein